MLDTLELNISNPNDIIVLVDMDGVLANFSLAVRKNLEALNLTTLPEEKLTSFYEDENYRKEGIMDSFYEIKRMKKQKDFFLNIPPNEEGLEAFKKLSKLGFNLRICSAPLDNNPYCIKEKYLWLKKYLGRVVADQAFFLKVKSLAHGNYLIDDKPNIRTLYKKNNWKTPVWQHVLFQHHGNKNSTSHDHSMSSWSDFDWMIKEKLLKLKTN